MTGFLIDIVVWVICKGSILWREEISLVCCLGESRRISSEYPEQYELNWSLFDGLQMDQNPLKVRARMQKFELHSWEVRETRD
ncbi:hypothetical protein KSC_018790 [Ktedonobacter sp. SOSP1-52]|nr:hypothetical protein KSC_018790 [Ktedonobacter sp. SOSP1-52]